MSGPQGNPSEDQGAVPRFRPYCMTEHGGKDGQMRLNPTGMYVRWNDYQRVHSALSKLFVLCLSCGPAALNNAIEDARKALDTRIDWDHVFRGTSDYRGCCCYGREGDSEKCPVHSICQGCGNRIDPATCGCGSPIDHSPWEGHQPIPMGCDCHRDKGASHE